MNENKNTNKTRNRNGKIVTIIGSGPAGLTVAWILSSLGHECRVIEKEDSIGGCHRVRRTDDDLFTEHGPRVYIENFVNFRSILSDMGLDFYNLFTPYKFGVSDSIVEFLQTASLREMAMISMTFVKFMKDESPSTKVTVKSFLEKHSFSKQTTAYIDRICRITDGAGIDRYTLHEFLQTFNQNLFYNMYQPREPNDEGLFKLWKQKLVDNGVTFVSGTEIVKIIHDSDKKDKVSHVVTNTDKFIPVDTVIFATPLENLTECIANSAPELHPSFGPFKGLVNHTRHSAYEPYLSMTFHWNKVVDFPKVWGGRGSGSWGILWINLSDYIGSDHTSKTLLSVSIVRLDVESNRTRKTAHATESVDGLLKETFRQINDAHDDALSEPDRSILSQGVKRRNGKWVSIDHAYMKTVHSYSFPFQSSKYRNLYSVGTHNEQSEYAFTSMESAVINSVKFCHRFDNTCKQLYPVKKITKLVDVIKLIIMFLFGVVLFLIYR